MSENVMPAVVVQETGPKGSWNRLVVAESPRPEPGPGEVLVQVEACSVNRADLLQRRGLYPPPKGASPLLGLDLAGYVVERGPGVTAWHEGDRVFGVVAGGGYGRYCTVPAEHLLPVPENLSFVEAAAAAEVFLVAYLNLFLEAQIRPGERLLVHGGGSGVGTAAIQLAVVNDIQVAVTCGEDWKVERCRELGAHCVVQYKREDFVEAVLAWTEGRGVDVVLDWIGAPYLEKHMKVLAVRGRLVMIGFMGGHRVEVSLAPLLNKRLKWIGSVLRSRTRKEKADLVDGFRKDVLPLLAEGRIRPVVDRIYSVHDVEKAHERMKSGAHFGKIVLRWTEKGPGSSRPNPVR